MDDQVCSRHSLVFEVYESSFRPTDLTSHLNVSLECGCVLSRISAMRDEVIGYKSPVLEDNILPGGQVRENGLSASRAAFPYHVCVHTNRWGETSEVPVVVVSCCAGGKVPYQCCKEGIGYFMKNMRSEADPPVSRLPCPSTPISWISVA